MTECIDELVLFEGGKSGFIRIDPSAITGRISSLAIPKGGMTAAQSAAIEAARLRAEAFGVKLIVTEF